MKILKLNWLTLLIAFCHPAMAKDISDWIQESYYQSYNYESTQKFREAINVIYPVYEKYPKGYTINIRLGWLYYRAGHYLNSLRHYETASIVAPEALEPKLGLLYPLFAQKQYQDIEVVCYQLLTKDFYNYSANYALMRALRTQKKYDLAMEVVNKMLALYPIEVEFLTQKALLLESTQQAEQAKALYQDILILDPQHLLAKKRLGLDKAH